MDNVSDVANVGGGGALVGWAFLIIFVVGVYFYSNTTSLDRYRIKKNIMATFALLTIAYVLLEVSRYLFS